MPVIVDRRYPNSLSDNATDGSLTHLPPSSEIKKASIIFLVTLSLCLSKTVASLKLGWHMQSLQCKGSNPPTVALSEYECSLSLSFRQRPVCPTYTLPQDKGIL
ncbi:unnamed protein product [Ixodes persulcatus]